VWTRGQPTRPAELSRVAARVRLEQVRVPRRIGLQRPLFHRRRVVLLGRMVIVFSSPHENCRAGAINDAQLSVYIRQRDLDSSHVPVER